MCRMRIAGVLKDKAVILVTHQLQFAKQADRLIVLEQGRVAADGTYDDIIQRKDVPFASVLLSYQVTGESSPDTLPPVTAAAPPGKTATVAGKPERKSVAPAASGLGVQQEDKAMGNVSWATYRDYFRYGGGRMGASAFFPLMVRGNRINSRPPTPLPSSPITNHGGRDLVGRGSSSSRFRLWRRSCRTGSWPTGATTRPPTCKSTWASTAASWDSSSSLPSCAASSFTA